MRQTSLLAGPGQGSSNSEKQPIQYFFEEVVSQLVHGTMRNLIKLTTDAENDHYTSGMPFFTNSLWSFIFKDLITDGPLSFLTSTGSGNLEQLAQFSKNYRIFKSQYHPLFKSILEKEHSDIAL